MRKLSSTLYWTVYLISSLLGWAGVNFVCYSCLAFVEYDFDVEQWHWFTRTLLMLFFVVWGCLFIQTSFKHTSGLIERRKRKAHDN